MSNLILVNQKYKAVKLLQKEIEIDLYLKMEAKISWEDNNQKQKISKIVLVEITYIVWKILIIISQDRKEKKLLKDLQEKELKKYESFILKF